MPHSFLQVTVTAAGEAEARTIAEKLIEERLAACVQIEGPITSVFRWEGKVQAEGEWRLIAKTISAKFPQLEQTVTALHSYDVPEILATPITTGSDKYLRWIEEEIAR